jgi:hypothetical protein
MLANLRQEFYYIRRVRETLHTHALVAQPGQSEGFVNHALICLRRVLGENLRSRVQLPARAFLIILNIFSLTK